VYDSLVIKASFCPLTAPKVVPGVLGQVDSVAVVGKGDSEVGPDQVPEEEVVGGADQGPAALAADHFAFA
jgi:hypothetical protein